MKIKALVKSAALAALVTLPAGAQADYVGCKVREVYAFSNRVHVNCSNTLPQNIQFFAVPTSSSGEAARFTTMASMALGDYLFIDYDFSDTSGPSFGCQLNDCRRVG
jgi:hypothetical protein